MGYDWAKIGILGSFFLFINGTAAWILGVEFSDPVRHATLSPYAPWGLYGGPILLMAACVVAFASYYVYTHREPELPRVITPVPPTQLDQVREFHSVPAPSAPTGSAEAPPTHVEERSGLMGRLRKKKKEEKPPEAEQPPAEEEGPTDGQASERLRDTPSGKR